MSMRLIKNCSRKTCAEEELQLNAYFLRVEGEIRIEENHNKISTKSLERYETRTSGIQAKGFTAFPSFLYARVSTFVTTMAFIQGYTN
jgi:hypothetical protein